MPVVEVDVAVVGGGLLGMCVATLLSREGRDVLVCRLSDRTAPHADTLRNQSWLQSGLRYFKAGNVGARLVFAKRMYAARKALHEAVSFDLPDGIGVFRVLDEAAATELVARAAQFGVSVQRLNDTQARAMIGDTFFETGSPYFVTPETTFEEGPILAELRAQVNVDGNAREVTAPVTIEEDCAAPCRAALRFGDVTVRASTTVLAAGAGNLPLLEMIGLKNQLQIDKTPLLVVPDGTVLPKTRVFVDSVRGCSVICHPPNLAMPKGALVIGVGETTEEDVPFCTPSDRRISTTMYERLWSALPATFRDSHEATSRITAGFEVKHRSAINTSIPWIGQFSTFPGLIAAIPGRATLSMDVAAKVVALVQSTGAHQPAGLQEPPWTEPIHMHHTPFYDHLNDRETRS